MKSSMSKAQKKAEVRSVSHQCNMMLVSNYFHALENLSEISKVDLMIVEIYAYSRDRTPFEPPMACITPAIETLVAAIANMLKKLY